MIWLQITIKPSWSENSLRGGYLLPCFWFIKQILGFHKLILTFRIHTLKFSKKMNMKLLWMKDFKMSKISIFWYTFKLFLNQKSRLYFRQNLIQEFTKCNTEGKLGERANDPLRKNIATRIVNSFKVMRKLRILESLIQNSSPPRL